MERRKLDKRYCIYCNAEIPSGRVKAIPDTTTCVKCSDVPMKTIADIDLSEADRGDHGQPRDDFAYGKD